jgi:hypothetical protein
VSRFIRPMPEAEQVEFLDAIRRFLGLSPWFGSRRAQLEAAYVKCPIRYSDRYNEQGR